jgi:hypothetical protein
MTIAMTRNAPADRLREWFIHPEHVRPSAMSATLDEALSAERRAMGLRIELALLDRGWTLDQEDGPQADVRAVLDEEAAR